MKEEFIMKKMIAVLITAAMVLGLAACGGTGTDGGSNGGGNTDPNGGGSKLDWSPGADASGGEVTLRVATWRQHDKPYYEEIAKRFEEKYDWIKVKLEINSDSSSYYSNLQADIVSGIAPDVFDSHPNNRLVTYAEEGIIAPQTDFDYMKNYSETAKLVTTIKGENYGYMDAYNYFGFLYNKDAFEKVGVSVPTTPEEMVDVVNKLKAAGYGGVVVAGNTYSASALGNNVFLICQGTEGYQAMQDGIDNGSITDISTVDGVKEALDTLQTYTANDIYYNAFEGISYEAGLSLYAQKKSAIIYSGSYILGEQDTYFPDINTGFFPFPTYANNGMTYAEGAQTTVINAASKNLGAAKLWVEFLATPEISEYYCSNAKMMSTIEGVTSVFDEMEMLQNAVSGYAIKEIVEPDHSEYWMNGFGNILEGVIYKGKDWKDLVRMYTSKLEEYDLASLSKEKK